MLEDFLANQTAAKDMVTIHDRLLKVTVLS